MSDKSEFEKELEKVREEGKNQEGGPLHSRLNDEQKMGVGVGVFIGSGLAGILLNPADPVASFFLVGFVFLLATWMGITKSGIVFRRQVMEDNDSDNMQMQQQIQSGGSQPKQKVCQNCGWQNSKENKYCHDCGNEI